MAKHFLKWQHQMLEKLDNLYIDGGNVNWYSCSEKQFGSFLKNCCAATMGTQQCFTRQSPPEK